MRTRIIATIGQKSESKDMIRSFVAEGKEAEVSYFDRPNMLWNA